MKKQKLSLPETKLIGLKLRTNMKTEMDPSTAQIGALVHRYQANRMSQTIPHRVNPGVTFCAYTEYQSDEYGDYTFFIGEEVSHVSEVPNHFYSLIIPAQTYVRFTTTPGPMPYVVIAAWQSIWAMTSIDFGGTRAYKADFEIYDNRASDPHQTVVDIYIGI